MDSVVPAEILTLLDLVTTVRARLDDFVGDSYTTDWVTDDAGLSWSNSELTAYANAADDEVAKRRPIRDSSTASICEIAVVAASGPAVPYSERILSIRRAAIDGEVHPLRKLTTEDFDNQFHGWEGFDAGTPLYYTEDSHANELRLFPAPDEDLTLKLVVDRLPVSAMTWANRDTDAPETPREDRFALIDWIEFLALQKRDEEVFRTGKSGVSQSLQRASAAQRRFEEYFGPRVSLRVRAERKREANLARRSKALYY